MPQNPRSNETLRVVGMDPSLRNWGLASGVYNLDTKQLEISNLGIIQPTILTSKQVRQNSKDLHSAEQLYSEAFRYARAADAVFVEVPIGSQSARAMASYALCVGVLGALRSNEVPFFEITPNEVKLISVGNIKATKKEMIAWGMKTHPEANWPTYLEHGKQIVNESKAEHMADALATIYAGLSCTPFQQTLPLLAAMRKNYADSTETR